MKLHVHVGPLPLVPPYFDWEDGESELEIEFEPTDDLDDEGEIDLTDLIDPPVQRDRMN